MHIIGFSVYIPLSRVSTSLLSLRSLISAPVLVQEWEILVQVPYFVASAAAIRDAFIVNDLLAGCVPPLYSDELL